MEEERCRWFEEEWGSNPQHIWECRHSRYLVPGTERCIFHLSKEHEKKDENFFKEALVEVISNNSAVWSNEDGVEYLDLFGFVFPYSFEYVFEYHPPKSQVCLVFAQLQGADLRWAQLQGADIRLAQLQGADISMALLQGADFKQAYLQGAELNDAHLQGAKLTEAQLQGSSLICAQLQGADLSEAHLQGALLWGAQLQGANLSFARLCADPTYRPGEEWDEWIESSVNYRWAKKRLLRGKKQLTGGLDAARLINTNLGAGRSKVESISEVTFATVNIKYETYNNMTEHIYSRGIVTPIYNVNNKDHIESLELELTPAVLRGTDLRGVDLSESTIAGADFTSARLDGALLRGTEFGEKKQGRYDSRWHRKNHRLYASEIEKGRIKLFTNYRRLKPKWLRFMLRPLIKLYVRATMIKADLPIFDEANIDATDWADNRRAQRDFVYAEYIRQFKRRHPILAFVWWTLADYGRSFFRWAFWCLIFAAFFGCAYWLILGADKFIYAQEAELSECWRCFYYSIVTFTTLGFGDIIPRTDAASIFVAVEVILGYVMLGGLISIFAVKVARRD